MAHPRLLHTAIDTTDARMLAEFYRRLLGLHYRPGDAAVPGETDDADWLVLVDDHGVRQLAFQQVDRVDPPTWPDPEVPMQMHLDLTVPDLDELERQRGLAEALGARLLRDRTDDPEEPLYVLTDPSGHPFCLFVA